ncbi:MAG: sigma-54-dependent Fis family transcriptional regulator [Deltaproteobacteria bacterium]|nr:sigma-54-dependent Fis family transcriptional regulator [Deltaproteobacteria bacterium]
MTIQTASTKNPGHTINLKDTKILIVDDEDILAWSIDTELRGLGAETMRAGSVREAIERFHQFTPDVAVTDLRLPDGNGLELLKKWRIEHPDMPVILITAHGAIDSAITALRLGACDYLQKPFDMKDLLAAVGRATEIAKLRQKVSRLQGREAGCSEVKIIGDTVAMRQLHSELARIAKSKAQTALILGESGSGKELAARAIHEWGDRAGHPFVEINCASIPETLLESELFGYEKGAFTDARERKLGLFEIARNGSIFLDEIGDMPLKLQAKLLRAIEYRRFKRLGSIKDIEFTGRIIAATHRNLLEEVAEKRFRADLYYRLSALPVYVPALRERIDDLPHLVAFFLTKLSSDLELHRPDVSREALAVLMQHDWPGNVRELKNVLERALVFYEPQLLEPRHLRIDTVPESLSAPPLSSDLEPQARQLPMPSPVLAPTNERQLPMPIRAGAMAHPTNADRQTTMTCDRLPSTQAPEPVTSNFRLPASGVNLDDLEKSLLTQALDQARHNQTRAAQLLGITRHTLRYRMEKHGLLAPHHGALA